MNELNSCICANINKDEFIAYVLLIVSLCLLIHLQMLMNETLL